MHHMHHPITSSIYKAALTLAVLTTQLILPNTASAQNGPPPAKVFLETAKLELLSDARAVTGEIRSRRTAQLASQVEGLTLEMLVEEGDKVTQGQTRSSTKPAPSSHLAPHNSPKPKQTTASPKPMSPSPKSSSKT